MAEFDISTIVHPAYNANSFDWNKWRLCYDGGRFFITQYLKTFSTREDAADFDTRKSITYAPTFAAGAVDEVQKSIYSRMPDITRAGGSLKYQAAVVGQNGGVDRSGLSMNTFIGQKVLPELLVMAKVGIYIDMPARIGYTLADTANISPYLYYYCAEDIRSWVFSPEKRLLSVLLRDQVEQYDETTGFPIGTTERFRRLWISEDGYVHMTLYTNKSEQTGPEIVLGLREIPFVMMEINKSLMTDIADYQIALLNLSSSNLSYALKANFPFYTEQYDVMAEGSHLRPSPVAFESDGKTEGSQSSADTAAGKEIKVGINAGRRYPTNHERPGFIHPSSEPLEVAMKLKTEMKEELRQLLNLTLSSLEPKFASAESKDADQRGLEAGLSYIGLELENAERRVAAIWAAYEQSKDIATINYPKRYSLKTDEQRRAEAKELGDLRGSIPSVTGRKEVAKQVAEVLLSHRLTFGELQVINREIDEAKYLSADAKEIQIDIEAGLVSLETASTARGYPAGEVEQAKKDHAEKLALIAESQAKVAEANAAARGVPAQSATPVADAAAEKKGKPKRGQGK
jgi:hypothetical protein